MQDDDLVGLQQVGHPVLDSQQRGRHFTLPCPALVERCCTVYGHRPSICQTYRCTLLDRYRRRDIDAPAALDIIESTIEVRDRVRTAIAERLGGASDESLFDAYAELTTLHDEAPDPETARRNDADLLLDIGMLRRLLSRYFDADEPVAQPVEMPVSRR